MRRACVLSRQLLIAATGLLAGGCMSWKAAPVSPDQVLEQHPNQVRVIRSDGTRVVLLGPAIVGDSLVGSPPGDASKRIAQHLAIPLSEVQSVEVQRVSAGKTALLVAGVGVTALAVIAAADCCGPDFKSPSSGGGSGGGSSGGGEYPPGVSCPLVYSWDGVNWRLDSGTFGGAIAPALARTDVDNLAYATSENGFLRLRVANELAETDYLDALSILAVDHDPGATVAPDAGGRILSIGRLAAPLTARDDRGNDVLARVREADGWNWESIPSGRDTASARDIRDGVELTFLKPRTGSARLVLDGNNTPWAAHLMQEFIAAHGRETAAWYDSLSSHPALAREIGTMLAGEAFLGVSVWSSGRWQHQGFIWEAGPEIAKRQVFPLDLSGVRGDTVRIRLESAPSFWLIDQVGLDTSVPLQLSVTELWPESAVERSGADIRELLGSVDRRYYTMENGAFAELRFRVPNLPAGRARSYLVRSTGWYRVHGPETQPADVALLRQVLTEPHGVSRVSVARFQQALIALGAQP